MAASIRAPAAPRSRYNDYSQAIRQVGDVDPTIRAYARLLVLNADGLFLPKIEAALKDPSTNPAARVTLQTALKYLKPRYAKREAVKDGVTRLGKRLLTEWKRVGQQDARWDKGLARGFGGYAYHCYRPLARESALREFQKAHDAGCRDPLVLYIRAQLDSESPSANRNASAQELHDATLALLASKYSDVFKAYALSRCYRLLGPKHEKGLTCDDLIRLCESAAVVMGPDTFVGSLFEEAAPFVVRDVGREAAMNKMIPAYKRAFPKSGRPFALEGRFAIDWAWDARGSGSAGTVTPLGWKLFNERIDMAQTALLEAWKRDPSHADVAEMMITVCMAKSDRPGVEKWCQLGLQADPDDRKLATDTLYALMPRWLGSHKDMLRFGRECAAGSNYTGQIVSVILDAHAMIANDSDDPSAYLSKADVWDDVQKVFGDYLYLDDNTITHAQYALWAARCGHWDIMEEQCKLMGDKIPYNAVFGSQAEYERLRSQHILPNRFHTRPVENK
jgi:hypothetical protein